MTEPMNGNNGMHDMTFKLPILLHGGDYVTPDEFAEAIFRYCAQVAKLAVDKYISGTKAGLIARQAVLRECGLDEE